MQLVHGLSLTTCVYTAELRTLFGGRFESVFGFYQQRSYRSQLDLCRKHNALMGETFEI